MIYGRIGDSRETFRIIFREVFFASVFLKTMDCFIVGYGSFFLRLICSHNKIAINMYNRFITGLSFFDYLLDAVISIHNVDVAISEIVGIAVGKIVIPSGNGMIPYSVTA